jgi:hypothetical protein
MCSQPGYESESRPDTNSCKPEGTKSDTGSCVRPSGCHRPRWGAVDWKPKTERPRRKHKLRQMREQGSGAIVNSSSLGGLVGLPERVPYHASKHGVTA